MTVTMTATDGSGDDNFSSPDKNGGKAKAADCRCPPGQRWSFHCPYHAELWGYKRAKTETDSSWESPPDRRNEIIRSVPTPTTARSNDGAAGSSTDAFVSLSQQALPVAGAMPESSTAETSPSLVPSSQATTVVSERRRQRMQDRIHRWRRARPM